MTQPLLGLRYLLLIHLSLMISACGSPMQSTQQTSPSEQEGSLGTEDFKIVIDGPEETSFDSGSSLVLSSAFSGPSDRIIRYDWQKESIDQSWQSLSMNSPTLSFASLATEDTGTYRVFIEVDTDLYGPVSAFSEPVEILVRLEITEPDFPLDCDGVTSGAVAQTRVRYKNSSVPSGTQCQMQTQTRLCQNGILSDFTPNQYKQISCKVESSGGSPVPDYDELPTTTPSGKVIKTADLGWVAGEDITSKFKSLIGDLNPGDEVQVDAMYEMSADDIRLPDDIIIKGVSGAGFILRETMEAKNRFLHFGNRNTIYNLIIKDKNPRASEQETISNNKWTLEINDKKDVKLVNVYVGLNSKMSLRIFGTENLSLIGVHFENSYYQIHMGAPAKNIRVERSLFQNSWGDGIKTSRKPGKVVSNVVVKNTVFEFNKRDGLDLTGGFQDSLVTDCIFRSLGVAGLDIKSAYQAEEDYNHHRGNENIRIENTQFIDTPSGIVLTTNDYLGRLRDDTAAGFMPRFIYLENIILEDNRNKSSKLIFSKDGHDVYWKNIQLLGGKGKVLSAYGTKEPNASGIFARRPNLSVTNWNFQGENVNNGDARGLSHPASKGYPDEVGPR